MHASHGDLPEVSSTSQAHIVGVHSSEGSSKRDLRACGVTYFQDPCARWSSPFLIVSLGGLIPMSWRTAPAYDSPEYWQARFAADVQEGTSFEWLGSGSDTLLPPLTKHLDSVLATKKRKRSYPLRVPCHEGEQAMQDPRQEDIRCLNIGCGSSALHTLVCALWEQKYGLPRENIWVRLFLCILLICIKGPLSCSKKHSPLTPCPFLLHASLLGPLHVRTWTLSSRASRQRDNWSVPFAMGRIIPEEEWPIS